MIVQANVTITIPISLEFDDSSVLNLAEVRNAALENFIRHPALKQIAEVEGSLDSINVEMSIPLEDQA